MRIDTWKKLVAQACALEEQTLICAQLPHDAKAGEMLRRALAHVEDARRLIYAAMHKEHPRPYAAVVEAENIETLDDIATAIATTDNQTERKPND